MKQSPRINSARDRRCHIKRRRFEVIAATASLNGCRQSGRAPRDDSLAQMTQNYRRLGELLVARSAISNLQLSIALADQRISNRRLGEIVIERGYTTESEVAACLAYQYGCPVFDLKSAKPQASALAKLTAEDALALRALPIEETADGLICAISDPIDVFSTDKLAHLTRSRPLLQVAPEASLLKLIRLTYGLSEDRFEQDYPESACAPARFVGLVPFSKVESTTLFDATDSTLNRTVTLMAFSEKDPLIDDHVKMVRSAARSSIEGLASIYDCFSHNAYRWTSMQKLSGESLADIIRLRGPRSLPQAAALVSRVAQIVDTLQRSGGSGAWASPANVMMRASGPLLAPIVSSPSRYVVPQGEHEGEMPGPAAAFALGKLLEDCLSVHQPKGGRELLGPMKELISRCASSDAAERFGSAIEVASALRAHNWQELMEPSIARAGQGLEPHEHTPAATVSEKFWSRMFKGKVA